jgi:hypothetical protein
MHLPLEKQHKLPLDHSALKPSLCTIGTFAEGENIKGNVMCAPDADTR